MNYKITFIVFLFLYSCTTNNINKTQKNKNYKFIIKKMKIKNKDIKPIYILNINNTINPKYRLSLKTENNNILI